MRVTDGLLQIVDSHARRMALAQRSLEGLALGDAFGETFFGPRAEVAEALAFSMSDSAEPGAPP